jgi:glycosyltransferase involved in cell wall biosynthesis
MVLRTERGLPASDVLVLAVGRLEPVKGHSLLLDALHRALPRAPHLRLAILGAGSLEESLRARSHELGIAGRVDLLGFRRDVAEWMRCADIFAMPSWQEGMPLALLEAMACGLPIIASAVPGVIEALGSPRAGVLVQPGDSAALAEALVRLSEDVAARESLGTSAERRASAFSIDSMVDRYCAIYREVLA